MLGISRKRAKRCRVKPFLLRTLAMSAAVAIAAWFTDIRCSGLVPALVVGMLLAGAQLIIRPALIAASVLAIRIASPPAIVVVFFATNVLIFWTIGMLVPGFTVAKFSSAVGGSIITSIAGFVIHSWLRLNDSGSTPPDRIAPTGPDGMKQAKGREIR